MSKAHHFVLAAGGTGGHMVPAAALAAELGKRGHHVALISDERGVRFPGLFDGVQTHILPAGRLSGGPIGWAKAAKAMLSGRGMAIWRISLRVPRSITESVPSSSFSV